MGGSLDFGIFLHPPQPDDAQDDCRETEQRRTDDAKHTDIIGDERRDVLVRDHRRDAALALCRRGRRGRRRRKGVLKLRQRGQRHPLAGTVHLDERLGGASVLSDPLLQLLRADWSVLGTVRSLDFILLTHGFNVSSLHALGAEVLPHFGVTEKNQRDDAQRQVDHVAVDDVNDLHDGDGPSGGEGRGRVATQHLAALHDGHDAKNQRINPRAVDKHRPQSYAKAGQERQNAADKCHDCDSL